jgi:hypothetical protein
MRRIEYNAKPLINKTKLSFLWPIVFKSVFTKFALARVIEIVFTLKLVMMQFGRKSSYFNVL